MRKQIRLTQWLLLFLAFGLAFDAAAQCPSAPAIVSPSNGATAQPTRPTLKWTDVGADSYDIWYGPAGSGCTAGPKATVSGTSFNPPELNAGTSYEWRVVAKKASCSDPSSSCATFTTAASTSCPSIAGKAKAAVPPNGATGVATPVTFQWTTVSGAKGYRVIATFDGGTPTSLGSTTSNQLSASVPAGTVSWVVETLFGDGCATTISDRATFTAVGASQCNGAGPSLVSPLNTAVNASEAVTFSWNAVSGATEYRLYVASGDDNFQRVGETDGTTLTRLVAPGIVKWYVVAEFAACPETKSGVGQFTATEAANCPVASVTLTAPAPGARTSSPVTFAWNAVSGASSYRLWISVDGSAPAAITKVTDTKASIALPSGSVEWFVEAIRPDCEPVLSAHSSFTVAPSANCGTAAAPVLSAPVGIADIGETVTFSWNGVSGAIAYRVWIARNGTAFADLGFTRDTSMIRELPAASYSWYVEALFDGCPPTKSTTASFTVTPASPRCTTAAPVLLAPASDAFVTSPITFTWSSVSGAEEYRVFASLNGGAFVYLGSSIDTSLTRVVPTGVIKWYVEAVLEHCPSTQSAIGRFSVPGSATCGNEKPTLVSPAADSQSTSGDITFIWNAVSGAVRYVLMAQSGDGAQTPIGETTETQLRRQIPAGTIRWSVIAFFAGCEAQQSEVRVVEVVRPPECATRRPLIIEPAEDALVPTPVTFSWTAAPGAKGYRVWVRESRTADASPIATTTATQVSRTLGAGEIHWFVEAFFESCPPVFSTESDFTVTGPTLTCLTPDAPTVSVVGKVVSGSSYNVRWRALPNVDLYEVQESTTATFASATTATSTGTSLSFTHTATAAQPYYYRVRGVSSCSDARGNYSDSVMVLVVPQSDERRHATAEIGVQAKVGQQIKLPGQNPATTFTASVDKPWLTVTPASGTIGPDGVTLTVAADPSAIALGTNTGTVTVQYGAAGKGISANGATATAVPVSVSLVTPVTPGGRNTPAPDSLIIPAVAHAAGANNSEFESDVRVTNTGAQTMRYQLNFTPSNVDGTQNGTSTTIEVEPGGTMALDDVLANFFATGTAATTGMLEIRPMTTASSTTTGLYGTPTTQLATVASSRTYNVTPTGTFGQFIPAVPFSQFIGKSTTSAKTILSLQQISESSSYRTNFGFVEGSGTPADILLSVFDKSGSKVAEIPLSLQAGEHKQINQLLAANHITLDEGRVEVEVTSAGGKVTAYASTIDNRTNDPLLVSPVQPTAAKSRRYVVPGVADLNNSLASWRTDMRLYNAGSSTVGATLTFYPQGNVTSPSVKQLTLAPGEVKPLDNILQSLYGITNAGGSVVVTTTTDTNLVASARTYNQTSNGTYGQFIPGVTPAEAVGLGGRALQVLQLEQSSRFRTNIGVAETNGADATVEIAVTVPDSKVTPKISIPLKANEFVQIPMSSFGLGDAVYNARATVKVADGAGKVTAYGSVIDAQTQDPTYVPAQ